MDSDSSPSSLGQFTPPPFPEWMRGGREQRDAVTPRNLSRAAAPSASRGPARMYNPAVHMSPTEFQTPTRPPRYFGGQADVDEDDDAHAGGGAEGAAGWAPAAGRQGRDPPAVHRSVAPVARTNLLGLRRATLSDQSPSLPQHIHFGEIPDTVVAAAAAGPSAQSNIRKRIRPQTSGVRAALARELVSTEQERGAQGAASTAGPFNFGGTAVSMVHSAPIARPLFPTPHTTTHAARYVPPDDTPYRDTGRDDDDELSDDEYNISEEEESDEEEEHRQRAKRPYMPR